MIAKVIKGKGFKGVLAYHFADSKGRIIATNMSGVSASELSSEFLAIRRLRPRLQKVVCHVSMSAAPGEHLTDSQWIDIGHRYLDGMDFLNNQYIITRHTDTPHPHIHILVNRVTLTGRVVSDSHDWRRQEALMREIERDYGLRLVPTSASTRRAAIPASAAPGA